MATIRLNAFRKSVVLNEHAFSKYSALVAEHVNRHKYLLAYLLASCKGLSIINTAFCKRSHCCPKFRLWKWCHHLHCWLRTSSLTRLAFLAPILHLLQTIYDPVSISHLSQHMIDSRMSVTVVDSCNNQLGDVVFLWQDHGVSCIIR